MIICYVHADGVLKLEQLSRIRLFFGEEGQRLVQQAFVVIVGLGGVGALVSSMVSDHFANTRTSYV